MNPILENKLKEMENANDYECWYLVKQPTEFDSLCYLVSFLKKYKNSGSNKSLQEYISDELYKLQTTKQTLKISDNHRALRVAAYFGLIIITSSQYSDAVITDTFEEITARCDGNYEETEKYSDIMQRQIEKMFISSSIDEEYKKIRQDFRLYPVMLLYKILIELGHSTGKYQVSMTEYRYLVATTKVFEDFLETLLLIKLFREESDAAARFKQYSDKFSNRMNLALKQLDTLIVNNNFISLKQDKIEEVAKKVFLFEQNPSTFCTKNYFKFLGSKYSLFELEKFEDNFISNSSTENNRNQIKNLSVAGDNILLYGVPGCGKSYKIEKQYYLYGKDDSFMERAVFHPDYTYSDFVGQILPKVIEDKVKYKFKPGPFTEILNKAIKGKEKNPNDRFYLIIEEINRGNAPAIFGDIFQLLDRNDDGESEYGISNENIAEYIYGSDKKNKKIKIPSNLTILATMNTSDQNVFTLDTAFKRRWSMEHIENNINNCSFKDTPICNSIITWGTFVETINKHIIDNAAENLSNEDNRIGAFFVKEKELYDPKKFGEKVLMYLWNDAFKYNHDMIFDSQYRTLDELINGFNKVGFKIFLNKVFDAVSEDTINSNDDTVDLPDSSSQDNIFDNIE